MTWNEVARTALIGSGSTCFVAFCWGLRWHFEAPGSMPLGMRLLGAASLAAFAWFAWDIASGGPSPAWPVAVLLLAVALALFVAAVRATKSTGLTVAFATDEPHILRVRGPYEYVRHPFYSAYLAFWTATALARPGWAPWLATAVFLAAYWHVGRREEAKFARSPLAAAYAAYRRETGMFVPRGFPARS